MKIGFIMTTALFLVSSLLAPVSAKTEIIEQSEDNQCLQCSSGKETLQLVQHNRNGQQRQQATRRTRQPALNQRTTTRQPARRQLEYRTESNPQRRERQVQRRQRQQVTRSRSQRERAAQGNERREDRREARRGNRREAWNSYYWQRYPRHRYYGWYRPSIYWGWRSIYPSSLWLWDTYVYDRDSTTVYLPDRNSIDQQEWLSDPEIRKRLSDQEIKALDEFAATSNSREASKTSDRDSVLRQREADVLNDAGTVYRNQGKYTEALKYYKQALAIFKEIGDRQGEAEVLNNIGTVYKNQGKQTEALKYYEEALAIFREIDNP